MEQMKSSFLAPAQKAIGAMVRNKWFCLFWLLFGFLYVTIYGMLYVEDLYTEGVRSYGVFGVQVDPFMTATASIIGKTYPWLFRGWGLIQSISLALNIQYMFRRYGYKSKAANALLIAGTVCIIATTFIRSTEEPGLQRIAHWGTALLFAFLFAIAMGLGLLYLAKRSKKFMGTFILFVAMLVLMLALLIFVGKGGAIESIPMWGVYLILLFANYSNVYKDSLSA